MQFCTLTLAAVLVASAVFTPTTSATKCSDDQLKDIKQLNDEAAFRKACPASEAETGSFNMETTDPKVWANASLCKDKSCVEFLKDQTSKVPDCDHDAINMKALYKDELDLCVDLAGGKLTADEIKKRITNTTGDWAGSYSDWFDMEVKDKEKKATTIAPAKNATATATTTFDKNTSASATTPAKNATTPATTSEPTKRSGGTTVGISDGVATLAAVAVVVLAAV